MEAADLPLVAAAGDDDLPIAIHGGAGTMSRDAMTPEKEADYRAALDRGLAAGIAVLEREEGKK